jgi:hypothetical protein
VSVTNGESAVGEEMTEDFTLPFTGEVRVPGTDEIALADLLTL